jgi:hypothetical protein
LYIVKSEMLLKLLHFDTGYVVWPSDRTSAYIRWQGRGSMLLSGSGARFGSPFSLMRTIKG